MRNPAGLLEDFKAEGIPVTPPEERAWGGLDLPSLLPTWIQPLALAEAPLPVTEPDTTVSTMPSPRFAQVLLHALEVTRGADVLILGGTGGLLEALLASMVPTGRISVLQNRDLPRGRHPVAAQEGVEVLGALPPGERWDRILFPRHGDEPLDRFAEHLKELGFLLRPVKAEDGPGLSKVVRGGEGTVEVIFSGGPPEATGGRETARRVLVLEEGMENAWRDHYPSLRDRAFEEVVATTFAASFPRRRDQSPEGWLAAKAFHLAYMHQAAGELDHAEDLYGRSLAILPTAEAHTFLGWVRSFGGDHQGAMEECRRAIAVDPSFGNPYNDIGAYLIEEGSLEEAIPWFRKALRAPRYCCPFYAHTNLGRVFVSLGRLDEARREFEAALEVNPQYEVARALLRGIEGLRAKGPEGPFGP